MKKQIKQYIHSLGAKCSYSGNERTMFVRDWMGKLRHKTIADMCLEKFGDIPFSIVTI